MKARMMTAVAVLVMGIAEGAALASAPVEALGMPVVNGRPVMGVIIHRPPVMGVIVRPPVVGLRPPVLGLPLPPRPRPPVVVGLPLPPRPPIVVGLPVPPPIRVGLPALLSFRLNCSTVQGGEQGIVALDLTARGLGGSYNVNGLVTYTAGGQDVIRTAANGEFGERIDLVLNNVGEIHLNRNEPTPFYQGSIQLYGNQDLYGLSCSLSRN